MLTASLLAIFYIPLFFVIVRRSTRDGVRALRERLRRRRDSDEQTA
jgi:multidrug efflux pump